ncbi:MAG: leucine-rich repeat domain-containing protein [Oscillospiraceae bacterium]|nr:leucine-rich repeat domain-containing protein [Oscillospiraceae bacterium]
MMYEFGNLKYELGDKGITITGVTDNSCREISIPQAIDGNPVRGIGFRAFAGHSSSDSCKLLSDVSLPHGLTEISSGAFASCTSLSRIEMPPTVTKISDSAFFNCRDLEAVTVTDSLVSMADNAFEGCMKLSGISISFYDRLTKKIGFLPELFFQENSSVRSRLVKTIFVYIPRDEKGLYSDYVKICDKNFTWDKYDSLFSSRIPLIGKIKIALFRLQNPVELSAVARFSYLSCLGSYSDRFIEYFIKSDNVEMLMKFGALEFIDMNNIDDYIMTARITGNNNALLYLVCYRYKKSKKNKNEDRGVI